MTQISEADRLAEVRARLAILSLPKMSPTRSRWLFSGLGGPDVAVAAVARLRASRLPLETAPRGLTRSVVALWRDNLQAQDLDQVLARHGAHGIGITSPLDQHWPFDEDPEPPLLLFHRGDLGLLAHRATAAVVGTRRCTSVGRTVAYRMGHDLAEAGVAVVSGLAIGVDGAAHRGALDAGGPAIGVVASGLDVVYPGGNRDLWQQVTEHGLLLGEAPAGTGPERWRFPARNRLIASLSRGVVVVESHGRGGALSTVDEAIARDRPVMAVPGSVLSSASDGTNELLIDGATPVRNGPDVIGTLGLGASAVSGPGSSSGQARPGDHAADGAAAPGDPEPTEVDGATDSGSGSAGSTEGEMERSLEALIKAEVDTGPVHLDRLILASGLAPSELLAQVQALAAAGRFILDGAVVSRP